MVIIYNYIFGHIKTKEIFIDNFSNTTVNTLDPVIGKAYSSQEIKIEGYVNDTIIIRDFYGYPIYLNGKLEKVLNSEYYGSYPSTIKIEPYKATEGRLKIKHIIK